MKDVIGDIVKKKTRRKEGRQWWTGTLAVRVTGHSGALGAGHRGVQHSLELLIPLRTFWCVTHIPDPEKPNNAASRSEIHLTGAYWTVAMDHRITEIKK